jgi:hypothetical protein
MDGPDFCSKYFSLPFLLLGSDRSFPLQHGQNAPSEFMKISQTLQRFWPAAYLPISSGFFALYRMHVPTQYPVTSKTPEFFAFLDAGEEALI